MPKEPKAFTVGSVTVTCNPNEHGRWTAEDTVSGKTMSRCIHTVDEFWVVIAAVSKQEKEPCSA
jgi:hypothetical protein